MTEPPASGYWPRLISAIRAAKGWKQSQLAEELDSNQETVSRWERGQVMPSKAKQRQIELLAEGANLSSLGGISHIVRFSPFPMLLCDGSDMIIAASPSSGFQEGRTALEQTPAFQHAYYEEFSRQLRVSGFWDDSGHSRDYYFSSPEHGEFRAVLVTIRVHGSIYCVVQAIPS